MLATFIGEFFSHPAALEYSGNTCSNGCAYCFASLRCEDRRAQVRKLSNLCLGKSSGKGMVDWFFNHGYPICVSNRSDPFATSNRDNTGVVLQLLDMVENPVYFQTKGLSHGVDYSLLDGFRKKNVVLYITIDTFNDEICKRIEPGAPLPAQRLELIRYAKSRGWFVEVGINPCWKPWLPIEDFEKLFAACEDAGADGYYLQPLSLTKKDMENMSEARRARLAGDEKFAVEWGPEANHYNECFFRIIEAGKKAYMPAFNEPTRLLSDEVAFMGKGINPVQNFVNFVFDEYEKNGRKVFTFQDFLRVMLDGNPEMYELRDKSLYQYIMAVSPDEWRANPVAKHATKFEDVYRVLWNTRRIQCSPSQNCFLATVMDGERPARDYYGDKVLYFTGGDAEMIRKHVRTIGVDDVGGKEVIA